MEHLDPKNLPLGWSIDAPVMTSRKEAEACTEEANLNEYAAMKGLLAAMDASTGPESESAQDRVERRMATQEQYRLYHEAKQTRQ